MYHFMQKRMGLERSEDRDLTKSDCYMLRNRAPNTIEVWPWKNEYLKSRRHIRSGLFVWFVKQAYLTQENPIKRGIHLCSRCHLCRKDPEINCHLLLHCNVTTNLELLSMYERVFMGNAKSLSRFTEMLEHGGGQPRQNSRRKMIPACIWWNNEIEKSEMLRKHQQLNPEDKDEITFVVLFFMQRNSLQTPNLFCNLEIVQLSLFGSFLSLANMVTASILCYV